MGSSKYFFMAGGGLAAFVVKSVEGSLEYFMGGGVYKTRGPMVL